MQQIFISFGVYIVFIKSKNLARIIQWQTWHKVIFLKSFSMDNVINNSSSDLLKEEFKIEQRRYELRCLDEGKVKVPEKGKKSCTGFSYLGPKLWNYLPGHIRKTTIREIFKDKLKDWIWEEIPSVWSTETEVIDALKLWRTCYCQFSGLNCT